MVAVAVVEDEEILGVEDEEEEEGAVVGTPTGVEGAAEGEEEGAVTSGAVGVEEGEAAEGGGSAERKRMPASETFRACTSEFILMVSTAVCWSKDRARSNQKEKRSCVLAPLCFSQLVFLSGFDETWGGSCHEKAFMCCCILVGVPTLMVELHTIDAAVAPSERNARAAVVALASLSAPQQQCCISHPTAGSFSRKPSLWYLMHHEMHMVAQRPVMASITTLCSH